MNSWLVQVYWLQFGRYFARGPIVSLFSCKLFKENLCFLTNNSSKGLVELLKRTESGGNTKLFLLSFRFSYFSNALLCRKGTTMHWSWLWVMSNLRKGTTMHCRKGTTMHWSWLCIGVGYGWCVLASLCIRSEGSWVNMYNFSPFLSHICQYNFFTNPFAFVESLNVQGLIRADIILSAVGLWFKCEFLFSDISMQLSFPYYSEYVVHEDLILPMLSLCLALMLIRIAFSYIKKRKEKWVLAGFGSSTGLLKVCLFPFSLSLSVARWTIFCFS